MQEEAPGFLVRDSNMSLDLHGYTVSEALTMFVSHYNERLGRGDTSRFTVIHGYGSGGTGGKIRTALRKLLAAFPDEVVTDTTPVNPGVTIIMPIGKLPGGAGILTGEIYEFCINGKTESKILGKFRQFGDLKVKNALRQMVKNGRLSASRKGKHAFYSSL